MVIPVKNTMLEVHIHYLLPSTQSFTYLELEIYRIKSDLVLQN